MVQYNNEIMNFDMNKIPLEQQICFLKVPQNVKEKAMAKLKEVKSKGDDNGSKARQYLDGLLKIPFQFYKREPSLNWMNETRELFKKFFVKYEKKFGEWDIIIPWREKYTNIEIYQYIQNILLYIKKEERQKNEKYLQDVLLKDSKKTMIQRFSKIKNIFDFLDGMDPKIKKNGFLKFVCSQIKNIEDEKIIEILDILNT